MPSDALDQHVGGLVRGDEAAFEAVYDLTSGLLASVANGMLGNHMLAEDVVQDVYLRLTIHAGTLRMEEGRSVRAWLLTSVRRRCLDVRSSSAQRLERSTDAVVERADTHSDVEDMLDSDLSPEMRDALTRLTEDQRTALVLTHIAGLSGHEVGEIMGRNRAAVYSLLRRAERATRRRIRPKSAAADH